MTAGNRPANPAYGPNTGTRSKDLRRVSNPPWDLCNKLLLHNKKEKYPMFLARVGVEEWTTRTDLNGN